ncbi:HAD family hydrolase [Butyrivibrio sp. XBB1001]|uniref:HAD family hydrolase n=1 Tax=Butyrivibrio sp. XBB1001 TaxID=1280682 RepID=UPI0003F5D139|nr:HAD family hydrolase [Butyrivibrio sp. XBB1001]
MKEYENYIFDLYGTLIDIHTDEEDPTLWEKMTDYLKANFAVEYTPKALRQRYLEICAEEEKNLAKESGVEFPEIRIEKVWVRLVHEDCSNNQIRALCIFFREASRDKLVVYEGVTETLDKLKKMGKGIYLLSNAQRVFTEKELSDSGLTDYFDDIFISSDQGIKKPQKEFLQRLLTKNSLSYEKCVMIGNDIFSDVGVAFKNGMESVFLNTYDFSEKKIDNELSELGVKGSRLMPVIVGDGDIRRILP